MMPLIGKSRASEERIDLSVIENPRSTLIAGDIVCPLCNGEFVLKAGKKRIAHFAHKVACSANFDSHPESAEHNSAKLSLIDEFRSENYPGVISVDLEVPIRMDWRERGRIADVLIEFETGWFQIHEIQLSSITTGELEERTADYERAGYDVIWWLGRSAQTDTNIQWCKDNIGCVGIVGVQFSSSRVGL